MMSHFILNGTVPRRWFCRYGHSRDAWAATCARTAKTAPIVRAYLIADDIELRSASSLSRGERVDLFNAAYADYFIPFRLDDAALDAMTTNFDLDVDASRVALDDGGRSASGTWASAATGVDRRRRRRPARAQAGDRRRG